VSVRFSDGPAQGVTFDLRRAPLLLRLVQGPVKWDALDQPEDTPEPDETVHVYRMVPGTFSPVYVCVRGRNKGAGGRWESGEYRHVPDAPVEDLRDNEAWRAWASRALA